MVDWATAQYKPLPLANMYDRAEGYNHASPAHLCCAGGRLDPVEQHSCLITLHAQSPPQVRVVHCLEDNAQRCEPRVAPILQHLTATTQHDRTRHGTAGHCT